MAMQRRRQLGHGWFELALAAVLISVLAAALITCLLRYQKLAEKSHIDITVLQLRTALRWQVARELAQNRPHDLGRLAGANPILWLERPPVGYLGEHAAPGRSIPAGSWYFDPIRREIVYLLRNSSRMDAAGDPPRLAWQVRPLKSSSGTDVNGPVSGLVLARTDAPVGPEANLAKGTQQ